MWILYQLAVSTALALSAPWWFLRRRPNRRLIGQRFGNYSDEPSRDHDLWIHAVSVGEVAVATALANALPASCSLLVTTVTPTGQERARANLGQRATVAYLPVDLRRPLNRFIDHFKPRALVLVESELWPLLLDTTRRRGIATALVNARISDRSFKRLERFRKPARALLLGKVDAMGAQSHQDLARLEALGVDPASLMLTGNLKYDVDEPPRLPDLEKTVHTLAAGRRIFVAGSTMVGEERQVLDAFNTLESHQALLVLAPRHPERCDAVAREIEEQNLNCVRRSTLDAGSSGESEPAPDLTAGVDVLLLDTLGELASIYRLADASFIGGTLVDTGGHNPLEAARFAKPVIVGPSMQNFKEMADLFDDHDAWIRVESSTQLADRWRAIVDDREAFAPQAGEAGKLVERHRGALGRTLGMLKDLGVVPGA